MVTGQDADLVACQRIAAGTQAMSIYKPIKNLANRVAEIAVAMARGKPIIVRKGVHNNQIEVPSVMLEVTVVTKDNLRETVIVDGFHAEEDVYQLVNHLTAKGKVVVLVSSELPEVMGMSDRMVILSSGQVGGRFDRQDASQEGILAAAMAYN